MNDRLKFRAFVSSSCYDEDGEDKDISFLVYNVAVYSDGTIGASKDDLKEAIKKLELSIHEERTLWEYFIENYGTFDEEWFVIDCNKIDQYTTLKDKNGNFIFEGDILEDSEQRIIVKYDTERHCVMFDYQSTGAYKSISNVDVLSGNYEVIGNVHENKELLND